MKNSVFIVMLMAMSATLSSYGNSPKDSALYRHGYLMEMWDHFTEKVNDKAVALGVCIFGNYSQALSFMMATCTGFADAVDASSIGIVYSNGNTSAVIGAADGQYGEIYDSADRLVLDLTDEINTGESYTITWRRKASYTSGGTAIIVIEESADNMTWNENTVQPSTSSQTFTTSIVTTQVNTRYLRLRQATGSGRDLDFDAVAYTGVQCGSGGGGGGGGAPVGNLTCSAGSDEIEGTVFLDFNFDGLYDLGSDHAGLKGMPVAATDSLGNSFNAITNSAGAYTISGLVAGRTYRVEFTFPDSLNWAGATFKGGDNGTAVQFVQSGNCANLGVASPRDFCDDDNPPIIVSCYETGNAVYGATGNENKGVISLPYQSSGASPVGITGVADIYEVGTVWGLAWQPTTRRMFAATFLKRHSGLGPEGMGGIYVMDFSGATGYITTTFDLQGVTPANGGSAIDLGSVTRTPGNPDYELPDNNTSDNYDLDAFDKVGKVGYGDADLSENDSLLWTVNMNQRAIISVDVSDSTSYPGTVNQYLLSSMTGLPTCPNGTLRPWGLGLFRGRGYMGCVCTAESGGSAADMHAYVFSFDTDDPTTMTQEIDFELNYTREKAVYFPGYGLDSDGDWHPWVSNWAGTGYSNTVTGELAYAQPVISDIDFTEDGSMILGLADRFGFQMGYRNYKPVSGQTGQTTVDAAGDIIKVCKVDGEWVLEGGTGCAENDDTSKSTLGTDGPSGTGEFFYSDAFDDTGQTPTYNHNETFIGSLGVLRGTNEVVAAHYDPVDGNGYGFDLGLIWHNAATGARADDFRIIESGPVSSKGNNLGDVAMVCSPPPLEIGNFVWLDEDNDGVQDAGEPGLEGVRMELYDISGVLLAYDSTDAFGEYYFSGDGIDGATWLTSNDTLKALTMYYIVAGGGHYTGSGLSLGGNFYQLTTDSTSSGANRYEIDSDGTIASGIDPDFNGEPYVKITTKLLGQDDHSFDFGFTSCAPTVGSEDYTGCEGDGYSVTVNSTLYNQANPTGTEILTNAGGCDSTVTINLVFHPATTGDETYTGCLGDGYSVTVNGTVYNMFNPSGTETLTNANGCDSTVTINLTYHPNPVTDVIATLCPGDSMVVNGTTYNEGYPVGSEVFFGGSQYGCDSTVSVNLSFYPPALNSVVENHCDGDGYSITLNGITYNQANPTGVDTIFGGSSMGCDSIINVNLSFHPETSSSISEDRCAGDGYSVTVNGTIYNEANPSGMEVLTNANNCDSTVTISLTFKPISVGSESYTGCTGDPYSVTVNGTLYNEANPTGTEVLTNSLGCDSTVTINLVFNPNITGSETYAGCEGDGYSVTVNGTVYNEANPTGTEVLTNALGCDSTVTVNLSFNTNLTGNEAYTGCEGDGYSVTVNGTLYNEANPAGMETLTSSSGCDSIVSINLVFNPNTTGNENYTGCEGDGYAVTVNGTLYNEANPTGTEVLTNSAGCDSTVTINLVFNPNTTGNENYTGCEGDGYAVTVNGTLYNEAIPTGTEVLTNSVGCDSTVTINLVFNPNTTGSETYAGCEGDGYSVTVNGTVYNEANPTGTEVLTNALGCDSTVTVNLSFNTNLTGNEVYSGCVGDGYSVTVNGTLYNEANPTGMETLTSSIGCDSIVSINLVFNPNSTGSETYIGCEGDGYAVTVNGTLYNEANPTGTEVLTNSAGCDSTVTINLVFNPNSTGSEAYTGCEGDGYAVTVNGTLYNEANPSGTEVLTNSVGCDSTVTINLVFDPNSTGNESYAGCEGDGYSVTVNGTLYNEANPTGTEVLTNSVGCDSTVTVNLVFNPNTTSSESYTGCEGDGYSVTVNGTVYNEANPTGTEVLTNALGCDSTVTVSLSFNANLTGNETYTGCEGDGYSVTVNGTLYNEANPAGMETLTSSIGCDSIVSINLVYNPNTTGNETYTGCEGDGYAVTVNSTLYNEANPTGTEVLTNSVGCDSTVTINLVFDSNSTSSETYTGCDGDGYSVTVNGTLYNEANPTGTEVLTNSVGCDSTVTINLVFNPNAVKNITETLCTGSSITVNGTVYNEANPTGTEVITGGSQLGCDSTININLTFNSFTTNSIIEDHCDGDGYSVTVNGTLYNQANPTGTETIVGGSYMGCDSIITVDLTFFPTSTGNEDYTGCESDGYSVTVNGILYNEANPTGTEVLTNSVGCDSTVTINLIFNPNSNGSEEYNGCEGDGFSVTVNGTVYNEANPTGTEILSNTSGCDSTVTINLVFLPNSASSIIDFICEDDPYFHDGVQYTSTGIYQVDYTSANGCDSTVTLDLTLQTITEFELTDTLCPDSSYNFFGQILTAGGTYHDTTYYAVSGCDSTRFTLNLIEYNNCTETFDLALRKTLADGQAGVVYVDDTVTFKIYVFNQGNVDAYNVEVLDYPTTGLDFNAPLSPGWVDLGSGPSWVIPYLPIGGVDSLTISFIANEDAGTGNIANYAEITSADDDNDSNNPYPVDVDSEPNDDPDDDAGGDPETPSDDEIDGDGSGTPTSNDPGTDEDDHDGAQVFFIVREISLGNLVFHDMENDGVFNNSDTGIEDVEVELYDVGPDGIKGTNDDILVANDTTDMNGNYLFEGLSDGLYFVKLNGIGIPSGFESSTGDGAGDNDGAGPYEPYSDTDNNVDNEDDGSQMMDMVMSDTIRLVFGEEPTGPYNNENLTVDFGLYDVPLLTLGNQVFEDKDNDGVFNNNDEGIPNVEVELYDAGPDGIKNTMDDILVDTQTTDSLGIYQFTNLMEGLYWVKLNGNGIPSGFVSSTGQGPTDYDGAGPFEPAWNTDSNLDNVDDGTQMGAMVMSDTIRMTLGDEPENGGKTNNTVDFGLYEPNTDASLGDYVWYDNDVDGQQDSLETGVPGIHVYLYDLGSDGMKGGGDDNQVGFTTTNSTGYYFFGGLTPGDYYVQFDLGTLPNEFFPTTPNTGSDVTDSDANNMGMTDVVTLAPTEHNPTIDMGIYDPMFDLALYKMLADGQSQLVDLGQDVHYEIMIENEGLTTAYNVEVTDYIPNGLILSPNDTLWTLINDSTAVYVLPDPIMPGDTATVEIIMAVQYGYSGQSLVNYAEVTSATDMNDNEVDDVDSEPDNGDPMEDDIDDEEIILLDHDPTGWIYCEKTGEIITGGTITVVGPNGIPNSEVVILSDGLNGYYEFFAVGLAGTYTIQYSHPSGYPFSVDCPPGDTLDPTNLMPPVTLGSYDSLGYLVDYSCGANPYYFSFDLEFGDPAIFANNIPMQCTFIRSIVCDDANNNDSIDVADTPVPNVNVYLYDCADTLNPIDSTMSDAQGKYAFDNLLPGNYMVGFDLAAGERFVSSGPMNQNGLSDCITLGWGGCDTSKVICIYACPDVSANDATTCYGIPTQLLATTPYGNGSYSWSPTTYLDNASIPNPIATPLVTTGYTVTYDDGFGCVDTDSITVFIRNTTPYLTYTPFADSTVECTDPIPFDAPSFNDTCDVMMTVVLDSIIINNTCGYSIQRTWTATNYQGNATSFVQTVTIIDTTAPTMSANHPILGTILHGMTYYADCMDIPSLDSLGFQANDLCSATTVTFEENVTPGDCISDGYVEMRYCGWTATDSCGNTDSLYFTIFVTDTIAPVLNGVPADTSVDCSQMPPVANVTATDNCSANPTVVLDEMSWGDTINGCYIVMRTWTATDDCGNSTTAMQQIQVTDNVPPTLQNVPPNGSGECSDVPPVVTAIDNCDTDVIVVMTETITADSAGCVTQVLQTWTATDDCGNQAIASRTLFVENNNPPVITVTHPMMAGVQDGDVMYLECQQVVSLTANDATAAADCCGAPDIEFFEFVSVGDCQNNGYWQHMQCGWVATDCCGNVDSLFFTVYIVDNTAPDLYGVPADIEYSCSGDVPMPITVFGVDNCYGVGPVSFAETTSMVNGQEVITRTWSVTDLCGNTRDSSQVITLTDQMAPFILNVPADTIVASTADVPAPSASVIAVDSCDASPLLTVVDVPTGSGCCYFITRTWTATNSEGMSSTASQIITVQDTEDPVITGVPDDLTVECEFVELFVTPVMVMDNCTMNPDIEITLDTVYTTCGFEITRTWTATDECGNETSESQLITVTDSEAPAMEANHIFFGDIFHGDTLYADCSQIPSLDSIGFGTTDNCGGNVVITFDEVVTPGDCAIDGYNEIRYCGWTATDDCGNTDSLFFTVIVSDTIAPVLNGVPADVTVDCNSIPANDAVVTATDNCSTNLVVGFAENQVSYTCVGTYTLERTWSVTDSCGNTTSATQVISVIDVTPPSMTANHAAFGDIFHGDVLNADCSQIPSLDSIGFAAIDDCSDVELTFTEVVTPGDCLIDGFIESRYCGWTATDSCGNTDSLFFTIIVTDTVAPELIGVPADTTIECDQPLPADAVVTATDMCFGDALVTLVRDSIPGACIGTYSIENTWTATDSCGNTASATQIISVVNTTPPTMDASHPDYGDIFDGDTLYADCSAASILDSLTFAAFDACCDVNTSFSNTSTAGNCATDGFIEMQTIGWISSDCCGNADSLFFTLIVTDTVAPELVGVPADVTVECDAVFPADSIVTAIDACFGTAEVTMVRDSFPGICAGTYTIENTWTATDSCGNTTSATQVITVVNTTPPVMEANHIYFGQIFHGDTLYADCTQIPSLDSLGFLAYDACCDVTTTFDETVTVGDCAVDGYVESRYCGWTATDCCGNTDSLFFTIIVRDTIAPELFGVPNDTIVLCDSIPDAVGPYATDLCDASPIIYALDSSSDTICPLTITRVWYAEDACGNITTDTQYIEAVERFYVDIQFVNPNLFGLQNGDTLIVDCSDPDAFALADAEATTNCGGTIDFDFDENFVAYGDCPQDHFIALLSNTWTASACGVDTSLTVYLLYVDSVGPQFDYTPADTTITCSDVIPAFGTPTASDACGGVALTSVDSVIYTVNGQDLLRIWTATDDCGNEAYFTQTIHVEGGVTPELESIAVSPEICDGADGAVIVLVDGDESQFDYTWIPDVGTDANADGNSRVGLTAGNYDVIVSNGSCADTFQFVIKSECGCEPAVVDSLSITESTCGMMDGSAEIFLVGDMSEYGFTWIPNIGTPNTLDNGRTGLPAGHYVVIMVHNGDNSCVNTLEFDIYDDCNRCGPVFEIAALTSFVNDSISNVCLPVPFGVSIGTEISINGIPYDGALSECEMIDVTAYDYSTVPDMAQVGPFHVIWEHDGTAFSTVVENMDQLAAGMSEVDANRDWYNDKKAFQVVSKNVGGDYGNMFVYTIPTGAQTFIDPTDGESEFGTYITLPLGVNEIEYFNATNNCTDVMTVTLEMTQDAALFQQDSIFVNGPCIDDVYDYCFELPAYLFDQYSFSLNGQSIDNQLEVCSYKEVIYYTYSAMAAIQAPYEVMAWSINGTQHSATFNTFSELVALLNQWDPTGSWILNTNGLSIEGGDLGNTYSSLKLRHPASGQIVDLAVNTLMTIDQYGLQMQPGIHNLTGTNFTGGASDNLTILIACTSTDYQSVTVSVGAIDTVCFASTELLGSSINQVELCNTNVNDNANIELIPGTNCLEVQGVGFGNDQTCVVICDEFGFCDTTYLRVRVLPKKLGPPESPDDVDPDLLIVNNGFSPNGDGINDYFSIEGLELVPNHTLTIFDRFGKKVFSTRNYRNDWGGSWGAEDVKDGTYYYTLEMKGGKRKSGYIQILR